MMPIDYESIEAMAEKDARAAAEAVSQQAMRENDCNAGDAALAEIYRHTYAEVYRQRLNLYENMAVRQILDVLSDIEDDDADMEGGSHGST